jgi:hypothetical protein
MDQSHRYRVTRNAQPVTRNQRPVTRTRELLPETITPSSSTPLLQQIMIFLRWKDNGYKLLRFKESYADTVSETFLLITIFANTVYDAIY